MITLKIYLADHEDTLIKISRKFQVGLLQMMSIESAHMTGPDTIITGERVNLPSINMPVTDNRIFGEFCPPVTESEFLREWIPLTSAEQMAEPNTMYLLSGQALEEEPPFAGYAEQWGNNGKKIGDRRKRREFPAYACK